MALSIICAELLEKQKLTKQNESFIQELYKSGKIHATVCESEADYEAFLSKILSVFHAELENKWNSYFSGFSTDEAKKISKIDRVAMGTNDSCLVYGEVTFTTLSTVLFNFVDLSMCSCFYDLGAGTGRGNIAAAMVFDWKKNVGIELLPGLVNAGKEVLHRFKDDYASSEVALLQGDFLKYDWSDGDVVFMNSTCFDEELMDKIVIFACKLKKGAYVLTLTKCITHNSFKLLHAEQYPMSWGKATVSVYLKIE